MNVKLNAKKTHRAKDRQKREVPTAFLVAAFSSPLWATSRVGSGGNGLDTFPSSNWQRLFFFFAHYLK
jgi:hypothetical protein